MLVFLALTFLTAVELVIPGLEEASVFFKSSSLILLAVGKAFIVAFFYMHLKDETRWLKFIAAVPISAAIYATVVILESIYR
jgi:heme/copper-type cytochrome/quinol oxidase subunit 4